MGERSRWADDAGLPWLSALDPVANARALGEIQRRGLQAAGEIVDRLVAAVDGDPDAAGTSPGPAGGAAGDAAGDRRRDRASEADQSRDEPDIDGIVDLWAELTKRSLRAVVRVAADAAARRDVADADRSASAPEAPSVARLDVEGASSPTPLRLRVTRPTAGTDPVQGPGEARGAGELWLHNGTHGERQGLRFHCGELRGHDGAAFPGRVSFDPEVVEQLPGLSSRGVVVSVVELDPAVTPGAYRGVVLVAGLAEVWLPVEVTVEP